MSFLKSKFFRKEYLIFELLLFLFVFNQFLDNILPFKTKAPINQFLCLSDVDFGFRSTTCSIKVVRDQYYNVGFPGEDKSAFSKYQNLRNRCKHATNHVLSLNYCNLILI